MSIPIGPVVDIHNPVYIIDNTSSGEDGGGGPTSGDDMFQGAADQSLQGKELIGKIGPAMTAYNAETENRLIQEY